MSNGKDHPGKYDVIPYTPTTAAAFKAFLEAQEALGFLLVGLNQDFVVMYKEKP